MEKRTREEVIESLSNLAERFDEEPAAPLDALLCRELMEEARTHKEPEVLLAKAPALPRSKLRPSVSGEEIWRRIQTNWSKVADPEEWGRAPEVDPAKDAEE